MPLNQRYKIVRYDDPNDEFFSENRRFDNRRAAKIAFGLYVNKHPKDADLDHTHGYYQWAIFFTDEQGRPTFMEERLSLIMENTTPQKDRNYKMFAASIDLSREYPMPAALYKSEGLALNALLQHLHDTPTLRDDYMGGGVLADVREVHLPNVPVLKGDTDRYFHVFGGGVVLDGKEKFGKEKKGKPAAKTTTASAYQAKASCHHGNMPVLHMGEHTIFAGGASKGANPKNGMVVIDLANTGWFKDIGGNYARQLSGDMFAGFIAKAKQPEPVAWLDFPLGDYKVPSHVKLDAWKALAKDIKTALAKHDVLMFCNGGHGRTGTTLSIVTWLLVNDKTWKGDKPDGLLDDPVAWLRKNYCKEAVDTQSQHQYVYDTLGLTNTAPTYAQASTTTYLAGAQHAALPNPTPGVGLAVAGNGAKMTGSTNSAKPCPNCNTHSIYVDDFGMCSFCQTKYKEQMIAQNLTVAKCNMPDCSNKSRCPGIRLMACGHVVHGQSWSVDQVCDQCFRLKNRPNDVTTSLAKT